MPNTKQRCFPRMCFSAGWQCCGGCPLWVCLGGLQRFVRGLSPALWPNRGNHSLWLGSCCPWSRATGLQSPGEVTPACQNLSALPLPRADPYSLLCNMQSAGGSTDIFWRWRKAFFSLWLSHSGCIQQYQEYHACDWPVISIKPIWSSSF